MVACLSAPAPTAIEIKGLSGVLCLPANDPVLSALSVDNPLDAVREAARRSGFGEVAL
jgi:hypothetical protein